MLAELFINKDYLISFFYIGVIFFALRRAYGIADLLRFLFRYFKFDYTDRKMKYLDEKWFNLQLFKITNGINVSNINDARVIQEGLNEGRLSPSLFLFSSSWGDVTVEKSLGRILWLYFVGLIFFIIGSIAWYQQESLVDGYARFVYMDSSYYVSKNKLIITTRNGNVKDAIVHSKQDCIRSSKFINESSLFSIACHKLLDDSETFQWWLSDEIKSVDKTKNMLGLLSYLYCIISVVWCFSLTQFIRASKQVRVFKASVNDS